MVLACPSVGATYITLEPSGQLSPSISRVTADSRDLPQRRPAAMTLKRVVSLNTCCCQFSRAKLSSLKAKPPYEDFIHHHPHSVGHLVSPHR